MLEIVGGNMRKRLVGKTQFVDCKVWKWSPQSFASTKAGLFVDMHDTSLNRVTLANTISKPKKYYKWKIEEVSKYYSVFVFICIVCWTRLETSVEARIIY